MKSTCLSSVFPDKSALSKNIYIRLTQTHLCVLIHQKFFVIKEESKFYQRKGSLSI